ncbi:MAG: CxxxxCH/CxxCH domain-containing protein, partial [Acidobacteria bacterium]|nr:CxxxxCH/CxxCH domain-containing protein [Acidobacteriota bacterium]
AHAGTSPVATAPLCSVCHTLGNPTAAGLGTGTCLSCHVGGAGLPNCPTSGTFPSIAGAHSKHMSLATTLTCNTCHAGSGTGTTTHYSNANARTGTPTGPGTVAIDSVFNAKGGTAAFSPSALTCTSVSCHGGQTTPVWTASGSINAALDCTKCHSVSLTAGDPQYNNAFGRHSLGTHAAHTCITCHNMANGSPGALAHFKYLNTPAVDGVATGTPSDQLPSGTIEFDATVTGLKTYTVTTNTQGNGGCTLTCHTHLHTPTNETWTASGSPHPIPFGAGQIDSQLVEHFQVTATTFASDCSICHAYSGTTPNAAAPLCNVCHSRGNPVSDGYGPGTCQSCHEGATGLVGGPAGATFPSKAGAHSKHLNLATTLYCESCHANSGTGTSRHYLNADARIAIPVGPATVNVDPIYTAKTGGSIAFTPATLTCSNISCHGGQVTPNWQTGSLNSGTQCTACHATTAQAGTATQYNDAYGRHSMGTHNAVACTTCHTMTNGSLGANAHFKYLNTPAVDGLNPAATPADQLPSGTILFDPAVASGLLTYSVNGGTQGNGGCALTCHTHIHVPTVETWTFNGPPHPISFLGNQLDTQGNGHFTTTSATFASDCSLCHVYSGTSPNVTAPACNVCHAKADPTQIATGTGTCLSCHTGASFLTLGPDGNAFPSLAGKHAKHLSLPTPLDCGTCHNGVGAGTSTHYQNANARVATPVGPGTVRIASTYDAETGTPSGASAAFNPAALTCSSVSCHGGQATPSWQTGAINSATQCGSCHAINGGALAAQYNDAVGRHAWGTHALAAAADCTLCHDMSTARHFAYLDTTALSGVATGTPADQLPSTTIVFKTNNATYPITGTRSYTISASTPQGDGGCALSCHSMTHVPASQHWDAPKGSAAHPVPFYSTGLSLSGNAHQTVNATVFAADCTACHDESGTSYKSGPVCTTCHIKGSPLSAGMTVGTCLSCHVGSNFTMLGPGDTSWPSVKGAHLKHLSLLTFTRATPALPAGLTASAFPRCEACHVGSVPYDSAQTHYSNANRRVASPILTGPATVSIHSTFNAKSGTAGTTPSATNFTCSNVSCHGGQVTPGWQTGTLAVNANTWCLNCHKATNTTAAAATQYNDAYGRHGLPTDHKATCDHCHDMNAATNNKTGVINHFKYLDTTVVSGVSGTPSDQYPSETIKFGTTVATPATGALTYTVTGSSGGITFTQGSGGCALSCHNLTHTPNPNYWTKP